MKKLITLLLALLLALSAVALGEEALVQGELALAGLSEQDMIDRSGEQMGRSTGFLFFNDLSSMLLALRAGTIDLAYVPECVMTYVMQRNPDIVSTTRFNHAASYVTSDFSMAVLETETELLDTLNAAIAVLIENGTIESLKATYIDGLSADAEPIPAELPVVEGARTVRVVVTGDLPPLDYVTADGQSAGFNVALLAAIGAEANINFELVASDAGSRTAMLASGRADAIFWMRKTSVYNADGSVYRVDDETPTRILSTMPYIAFPLEIINMAD